MISSYYNFIHNQLLPIKPKVGSALANAHFYMQSTKRIYSAQDLCRKSSLVQRNTFVVLTNFIRKVRKAFAVLNSSSS